MPSGVLTHLPHTQEANEEVLGEPVEEHLRDDEDVARQGALEHDGHLRKFTDQL